MTPPIQLHAHQVAAVDNAVTGLAAASRVQVIMACGTGKTYVAFEVARRLGSAVTVVLAPTIDLGRQTIDRLRIFDPSAVSLLVCAAREWRDTHGATTDPADIQAFLDRPSPNARFIVSTYASVPSVGAALLAAHRKADLLVLDEAHRAAGDRTRPWSAALSDRVLPARLRLFMTATRRLVTGGYTQQFIASMDDPKLFGATVYELPFGEAVEAGIICEIDAIVMLCRASEPAAMRLDNALMLAAVQQARERYGVKKIISFHGRTRDAEDFAATLSAAGIRTAHVSHLTPKGERAERFGMFAAADRAIITNARLLAEGVDVADVDAVLLATRKQSLSDLAQCIGRAARVAPGKQKGYVILPVVVPPVADEELVELLQSGPYSAMWTALMRFCSLRGSFDRVVDLTPAQNSTRAGSVHALAGIQVINANIAATPPDAVSVLLDRFVETRALGLRSLVWNDMARRCQERIAAGKPLNGTRFDSWLARQRQAAAAGRLSDEQRTTLAGIEALSAEMRDRHAAGRRARIERFLDALRNGAPLNVDGGMVNYLRAPQPDDADLKDEFDAICGKRQTLREDRIRSLIDRYRAGEPAKADPQAYNWLRSEKRRDTALWREWEAAVAVRAAEERTALEVYVSAFEEGSAAAGGPLYDLLTKYPHLYPDLSDRLNSARSLRAVSPTGGDKRAGIVTALRAGTPVTAIQETFRVARATVKAIANEEAIPTRTRAIYGG